ncbi:MAG TPA: glycosyltransferase [Rhizomicrobium sp.]|nr:glycosyltransferase [Rhizomicrobium sp.]
MTAQRILVCLHDLSRGGTERVALGLATSWMEAGRNVTILCGSLEGGLRETLTARVKVEELSPPVRRGFLSRFRLGRAMGKRLAALRPDVIFLPGNFHALLANSLRKANPRPAIALKISNPPVPQNVPFAEILFRQITRSVDGFAVMNSGLARELEVMLPGRNIVTLHDPAYVRSRDANRRRERHHNILWIGRLEPQKDPLLALKTLLALGASAHLTMLGEGSLHAEVERHVAALKLEGRVKLMGHVPEIESYLATADALLITSRYEGGPAVAVEALAMDVPVISTDCSYLLHDLLKSPESGKIVASRDPIDLAAALLAVCAKSRAPEGLRMLARPFEPEARAKAYLDWFDRLVGHG